MLNHPTLSPCFSLCFSLRHRACRDITRHKFHFGQKGSKLAFSLLNIIRQGFNRIPGHVGGRTPLALQCLFVQERSVFQPDFELAAYGVITDAVRVSACMSATQSLM